MHFLECYALNCGLKIDRPFIQEEETALPEGDFVTFHGTHSFQSKTYDNWQTVIDLVAQDFPNLKIVQLGTENRSFNNVLDYQGKTNFNQSAYLIKRSQLHFGIDSFPAHLASCFEIPSVVVYSHTYKEQCYPYFTKTKKLRLIQAPLNTPRPSYSNREEEPCINNVRPFEIFKNINELLCNN
jgi:ADP-heptose:LPS heptosyltransferase